MLALAVTATICSTAAPASFQISIFTGMDRDEELLGTPSSRSLGGGASRRSLPDSGVLKTLLLALLALWMQSRGGNVALQTDAVLHNSNPSSHDKVMFDRVNTHGT